MDKRDVIIIFLAAYSVIATGLLIWIVWQEIKEAQRMFDSMGGRIRGWRGK